MFVYPLFRFSALIAAGCALCFGAASAPTSTSAAVRHVELKVDVGAPLRIAIDEKTPIVEGEPVQGTLVHPLYVFDREVAAAGTKVLGRIVDVERASRAATYMQGKLRVRKDALVEFDTLVLADGRQVPLRTSVNRGAPAVIRLRAGSSTEPKKSKGGMVRSAKAKVKSAVNNNELVQALRSNDAKGGRRKTVRVRAEAKKAAAGKRKGLKNALSAYWPFGRQHLRPGTHFTASLKEPLDFGVADVELSKLRHLGGHAAPDSIVHARLLESVSSGTAEEGDPVLAVITRPLFSPEGNLILPEGATLNGEVTQVKPARRFGREGELRFRFTRIEMPSGLTRIVNGSLAGAEVDIRSRMRLDAEGGAKVMASKEEVYRPGGCRGFVDGGGTRGR